MLTKCLDYLKLPATQNGIYCRGEIRTKEAHCYTWDSSIGNSIQKISQQGKKKIYIFSNQQVPFKSAFLQKQSKPHFYKAKVSQKFIFCLQIFSWMAEFLGKLVMNPKKKKKKNQNKKNVKKIYSFHSIPFHSILNPPTNRISDLFQLFYEEGF